MATEPSTIGPFKGMNTKLPDARLRGQDGDWLRSAVNVDITQAGTIKRRAGSERALAGSDCHSLYGSKLGAFFVDGTTLYRLNTDATKTSVHTGLIAGLAVAFQVVRDEVWWSNGVQGGRIGAAGHTEGWGGAATEQLNSAGYMLAPMPFGSIVRHYKGRLLTVQGNTLFFSEPYSEHLYRPDRNWIVTAEPISLVVPMDTGVWLCAEKTYWLAGDLADTALAEILPYGAIPRSDFRHPDEKVAMWSSSQGIVKAGEGEASTPMSKAINAMGALAGATVYVERDGMGKAIASNLGTNVSGAAIGSFMDAEVIRKGTVK